MALTNRGNYSMEDTAEFVVYVPETDEHFAASLAVVPLQLLAYYVSVARSGCRQATEPGKECDGRVDR